MIIEFPRYTLVPNLFLDELIHKLNANEIKAFLCLIKRTFCFPKNHTYSTFEDIKNLSRLSKEETEKSLKTLVDLHLVGKVLPSGEDEDKPLFKLIISNGG